MVRYLVCGLVVLFVLGWVMSGGPAAAVAGWIITAYLVWRALPGVRSDIGVLWRLRPRRGSIRGQVRGA
jgi:hypothetical protein